MNRKRKTDGQSGFGFVELLIALVVVGVLYILYLNYGAVNSTQNKREQIKTVLTSAPDTSLKSDLANAASSLQMYQIEHDAYPAANDCSATPAENTVCLKTSEGNSFTYRVDNTANPQTYELIAKNDDGTGYKITNDSSVPTAVSE